MTRRKLLHEMIKRYVRAKAIGHDNHYAMTDLSIYLRTRFNINLIAWCEAEVTNGNNTSLAEAVPEEDLPKTIEAVKWCCINSGVAIEDLFNQSN